MIAKCIKEEIISIENKEDQPLDSHAIEEIEEMSCPIARQKFETCEHKFNDFYENIASAAKETIENIVSKLEINASPSKSEKKKLSNKLIGRLLSSTFFTFSHTLRVIVDCIRHFIVE